MPRVTRQAAKDTASPDIADRNALGEIDENVSPPPEEPKKRRSRSKAPKDQENNDPKPTRKTRGRGKKAEAEAEEPSAEDTAADEEVIGDAPAEVEAVELSKDTKKSKSSRKTRGRGRKAASEEPAEDEDVSAVVELAEDEAQEQEELVEDEAPAVEEPIKKTWKTRGRGRKAPVEAEEPATVEEKPVGEKPTEEEVEKEDEAPPVEELDRAPADEQQANGPSNMETVEDAKDEENQPEQLSNEMNEDITPETPEQETLSIRPKTPRFDPEIHNDEPDVGNDSFEMYCSPRKSARSTITSDEVAMPVVEEEETKAPELATVNAAKKTKAVKPAENKRLKANEARKATKSVSGPVSKPKPTTVVKPEKNIVVTKRQSSQQRTKAPATTVARSRPVSMVVTSSPTLLNRARSVSTRVSEKHAPKVEERAKTEKTASTRPRFVPPPPSQPVKSSKPPTKPTFELPGEALSRKFAAQREERRKKEEAQAEANKKKPFKAKPVPKNLFTNQAPENKETSADPMANAPSLKPKKQPTVAVSPQMMSRNKPKETIEKKIAPQPAVVDRKEQAAAVLRARREAAENGRTAVKMWAEQQKQRKLVRAKDGVASASKPTA